MTDESAKATNEDASGPVPKPRGRILKASMWVFANQGGKNIIRLASNLTLTRLLFEEAFGLMALVNVFLAGLQLFSDIGLGPAIIRHDKEGDEPFLNTAWCLSILRGALLFAICFGAAYPFAYFYEQPILRPLTQVAGLNALISGFQSTRLFEARRRLNQRAVAIIGISTLLANVMVMITLAWLLRSVWALVFGSLAANLVNVLLTHFWLDGVRNRLRWDPESAKNILGFGRWIFGSTAVTFLSQHTDRLVFGKLIPVEMLGVYHIGAMVAGLPLMLLSSLADAILFPLASQKNAANKDLRGMYARSKRLFTTAAGWMLCGFAAGGQTIIDLLFDSRYQQAGWMLQFLALAAWINALQLSVRPILLTLGGVKYLLFGNLARLALMLVFIPLGFSYFEFPGAVAGLCASSLGNYAVFAWATRRIGFGASSEDLGLTLFFLAVAAAGNLSARTVDEMGVHTVVEAIVVFLVVTAAWTPRALWVLREAGGLKKLLQR